MVSNNKVIKINSPHNYQRVENKLTVNGISNNVNKDEKIWIILKPKESANYYPNDKPVEINVNGGWSSFLQIADTGYKIKDIEYDIIAFLADRKANDFFENYSKKVKKTKVYSGIDKIPLSAMAYERVRVIGN